MESVRCPTPTRIDADESPKSAVSPQHPPPVPEEPEKPKSPPNERPPSPEPNCAICLGKSQNKSFTDSCLHQFCFTCLLEWSKVKPECPLCKQSFKSIIHNVRSNEDYDQYHLQTLRPQDNWVNVLDMIQQQRFRYRSTMDRNRTLQRAFEHLEQTLQRRVEPGDAIPPQRTLRRRRGLAPDEFRANVYRQNRWVVGLSYLGVSRDVSPQNFRNHPEEVHRLIPWLNRELQVVTRSPGMATRALDLIVSLLPRHHIRSTEFRQHLEPYLRDHYDHFIHEFYTFARCPYDMIGFDENANYSARGNYSLEVVHEVSDSSDSDVVVLPPENGSSPVPGTSHASTSEVATASPRRPSPLPGTSRFVLPVDQPSDTEANVSSDSSICEVENSDSEGVEIVGYVKPLHERTPEIINLLSDDEGSLGRSSHLMSSSTSSGSGSEYLPSNVRKSRKKVRTRKVCKRRECSTSDSDESCSCSSAHKQNFLWKPTKWSRSARSRCIISSNSSSSSHSSSSSSSRDRRKSKRQSWRIGSSRGRSPTYDPPHSPSEISSSSRPKLRSIVITRTKMEDKPSKNVKQESNPGPSSHRRKHSKSKKEDKKKRKWKKDSSSDRKKRKLRWSSGSSDD